MYYKCITDIILQFHFNFSKKSKKYSYSDLLHQKIILPDQYAALLQSKYLRTKEKLEGQAGKSYLSIPIKNESV